MRTAATEDTPPMTTRRLAFLVAMVALGFAGHIHVARLIRLRAVKTLLENPCVDDDEEMRFMAALADLARGQGLDPGEYVNYRSARGFCTLTEGRAVAIDGHVVAILHATTGVPGDEVEQLVLLDRRGHVLDKLACKISSRDGRLATRVLDGPGPDGARLVVHFVPVPSGPPSWKGGHTITHGGRDIDFEKDAGGGRAEWDRTGLCRVGLGGGRFVVVSPERTPERPGVAGPALDTRAPRSAEDAGRRGDPRGLVSLVERRERFKALADYHEAMHYRSAIAAEDDEYSETVFCPTPRSTWHMDLAIKYDRAAARPWLPVAPDPPEPPALSREFIERLISRHPHDPRFRYTIDSKELK
jgi:hypothetical protein